MTKKISYVYEISVPANKDFPAHTVGNGASVNGKYQSYQEAKDYMDIALQEDYPGCTGKIFQVLDHGIKIIRYEV